MREGGGAPTYGGDIAATLNGMNSGSSRNGVVICGRSGCVLVEIIPFVRYKDDECASRTGKIKRSWGTI